MGAKIASVTAREIFAARNNLCLEVTVTTDTGAVGVSTPEAGVSTGRYEAAFVLDGGERYDGMGQRKAAANVNDVIGPALKGIDVTKQAEIDAAMIALDGTPDKSRLGANAMVGVSLAAVKAAANSEQTPLYRYIGGFVACVVPIPILGIGTGGRYRDPGNSRWYKPSYEFCPYGAGSYALSMEWGHDLKKTLNSILRQRYGYAVQGGRGLNLASVLKDDRELLDAMTQAIAKCGLEDKCGIYFDAAAGCYYENDIDRYVGIFSESTRTRDEMIQLYKGMVRDFPIVSIEDPLDEEDFEGHGMVTAELGIEIVGDDLFTTNAKRVQMGYEHKAANSMVLKITQVGTVSEAMDAVRLCRQYGYNVHPCGSRGDLDSLVDFAVGLNAGQARGFDGNRLLKIEEELGVAARWLGRAAYNRGPVR
mgnify:CR=1 FL=1